jgi:phage terminase small subunit
MTARRRSRAADDRRARFILEYARDCNGTKAAIRAGYSPKSARVTASRLLTNAAILAAINQRLERAAEKAEITIERVLKEIARLAFGDVRKLYDDAGNLKPIHELDDEAAALLAGIETEQIYEGRGKEREHVGTLKKVKLRSKERALEMCMAFLGMHKTGGGGESGGLVLTIRTSDGKPVHEPTQPALRGAPFSGLREHGS